KRELDRLLERSVQLRVLGELDELPFATRQALRHAINKTRGGESMVLNLALNYSGRDEILRACRRMIADGLGAEDVNEETFAERLYTAGQPDPDLIIRTSGELRLSNYLLFQAAYSEFYFTDTLWPDFDEAELDNALGDYASRQRRFGATGEQSGTKE
ncbi:MAG: polyprenyl diphosphate synthase, partial [Oceanidesulfovibrio sp.]